MNFPSLAVQESQESDILPHLQVGRKTSLPRLGRVSTVDTRILVGLWLELITKWVLKDQAYQTKKLKNIGGKYICGFSKEEDEVNDSIGNEAGKKYLED